MNYSLITITKDKGDLVDGIWMQDCSGTTLEKAIQRARDTEAVNTGGKYGEGMNVAVVESRMSGSPNYSVQIDLERLDRIDQKHHLKTGGHIK